MIPIVQNYSSSVKVLLSLQSSRFPECDFRENKWQISGREYIVDSYFPLNGKPRGVILGVHGMTPYAQRDERLVSIAKAFAGIGFGFLMPEIPDIKNAFFNPENIKDIHDLLAHSISLYGKTALFGPSFSGGMALAAASFADVRDKVSAIMTIGTYSDGQEVLNNLIEKPDADSYAMLIIIKNVGQDFFGNNPRVWKAVDVAVKTDTGKRDPLPLKEYLESLSQADREEAEKIIYDPLYRTRILKQVKGNTDELGKKLNIQQYLEGINAPTLLLHGSHDNVIEPSQSVEVFHKMKKMKKNVRLLLTPFVSHGDSGMNLSRVKEILDMVDGFKFFIQHASL